MKNLLTDEIQSSVVKSEMLAELLLIDGRLNNTKEKREDLLIKALFLFEYAEKNSISYSEERIKMINSIRNVQAVINTRTQ